MIVALRQPSYLSCPGFFDKTANSGLFVIYDDAQFNRDDFQHRNKVRIYLGWKWLTVPVLKKCILIRDKCIKNEIKIKGQNWREVHLREIKDSYKNTPFYPRSEKLLEDIYSCEYNFLNDLNMSLINFLKETFGIKSKIIMSCEFGFSSIH